MEGFWGSSFRSFGLCMGLKAKGFGLQGLRVFPGSGFAI